MFFEVVGVVLLGVGCGDFIGRMLGEDEIEIDGNWKLWCMSDDLVFVIPRKLFLVSSISNVF